MCKIQENLTRNDFGIFFLKISFYMNYKGKDHSADRLLTLVLLVHSSIVPSITVENNMCIILQMETRSLTLQYNSLRNENLNLLVRIKFLHLFLYTVKPAHAVTCIKRSPFCCCLVIENFICI